LVGIIPLAGFWSKDEILVGAWSGSGLVDGWVSRLAFGMLLAAVVLTAFYTFRMLHMTFHGQFQGGVDKEMEDRARTSPLPQTEGEETAGRGVQAAPAGASHGGGVHLTESPLVMLFPMLVLGAAAVVSGYMANPQWDKEWGIPGHWISGFLGSGLAGIVPSLAHQLEPHGFSRWLAAVSTVAAVAGLSLAALVYLRRRERESPDPLESAGPVYKLLSEKYFVDALYEDTVVRRLFYRKLVVAVDWLDRNVVDGAVDTLGWISRNFGPVVSRLQTGHVQGYAVVVALGSLLIILGFLLS